MPIRRIEKGADFLAGPHSGLSADIDGRVFPADDNLLPDPTWTDLDQYGWLKGWAYPGYPLPCVGLSVYVRTPGGGNRIREWENTKEAGVLLDYDPASSVTTPPAPSLLVAPPAPDATFLTPATPPALFGFKSGTYAAAFALGRSGRFTGPSPRAFATQADENDNAFYGWTELDLVAATWADTVAWFITEPQADEAAAAAAPLYLLWLKANAGATEPWVDISGPTPLGLGPTSNATYSGVVGPVSWRYKPVSGAEMEALDIDLAWSCLMRAGRSAQQPSIRVITPAKKGQAVAAKPPYKPAGALGWRLEWRVHGTAGQWLAMPDSDDFDAPQFVYRDDNTGSNIIELIDAQATDLSGIPDPTAAPGIEFYEKNKPNSGVYSFSATALYPLPGSGLPMAERPLMESGPSAEVNVTASGSTSAIEVDLRLAQGNRIHNPEGRQRRKSTTDPSGTPRAYIFDATVAGDVDHGYINVADTSASAALSPAVVLKRATVLERPHCFRVAVGYTSHTGGTVRIIARQVDAAGVQLTETLLHQSDIGTDMPETEVVVDPEEGLAAFDIRIEHDGTTTARGVEYSATIECYEGEAAPIRGRAGGYVEWVDNPTHRHADLTGIELGMVEYFGAYDEPLAEGAHPKGARYPVRPGQAYALSVYAEPTGLESGSNLWASAFYKADGKLKQANAPVATFTGEDTSGPYARHVALLVAPSDPKTAYFEIVGNKLGRGRLRLMGMQWEKGTSATDFDPGVDPEDPGSGRTLELVQYMGFVGTEESPEVPAALRNMAYVGGTPELTVVGEGILGVQMQSGATDEGPWSDPVTDPADLTITPEKPYVKYLIEMGVE